MSDGLNIDDLQPRELLSLLNLNAPVSRGVILQRTAEMTAAAAGDPQTVKMINATGDKLAEIAAGMGSMTLVLDEEGGLNVPLYDATSAVQDDPVLQAPPTYPQEIIEGYLNPVRRRILTTCVGIRSTDFMQPPDPTIEEQRVGWGLKPGSPKVIISDGIECEQVSNTEELCALNKRRQACAVGDKTCTKNAQPIIKTPANFSFPLPAKFDNVISVTLKSLTFPLSVYNIGPTDDCCEEYSEEVIEPEIIGVTAPDGTTVDVVLERPCSNNNTFLARSDSDSGSWKLLTIPPGTYTLSQIVTAMNTVLHNESIQLLIYYHEQTGLISVKHTGDSSIDITIYPQCIAFPAVVRKAFRPGCATSEIVCDDTCPDLSQRPDLSQCPTSPLIGKGALLEVPHLILVKSGGLGPILGYGDAIFAELKPAALCVGPLEGCYEEVIMDKGLQTVVCPPSLKLYFVLNDYQGSNFPTFIGKVGDSTTSTNVLSEFILPPGDPGGEITLGENRPIGFPYATRNYFGPVTLKRLTVSITDREGNVVDTHGRPFEFVLELERIYNM